MTNESFFHKVARFVVEKRTLFLLCFLVLCVCSVFTISWVKVENDITFYLPEDAEARRGLSIMQEEFSSLATAKLMVRQLTQEQAQELSDRLAAVEHVALVSFDLSPEHYRDGCALFSVSLDTPTAAPESGQAIEAIKALVEGQEYRLYTEVGYSLVKVLAEQMATVLVFVVIVVLSVLLFTSSTYAEIPVMLLTFIVAALINMGSSFLLGTISFVSHSVAIVLQLALSVDYAIIFCNRYKEAHASLAIREAVIEALAASLPEISASSLTTIAGLTAMTLMKFRLGADMGLTLIKAIICSLLTVFFFMPCLLLLFGKAMDKTRHRSFVPRISFVGKLAYATRHVLPLLFVGLVILGYLGYSRVDYAYCQELVPAFRKTEQDEALAEITDTFGDSNIVAVLTPVGDYACEKRFIRSLQDRPEVKNVTALSSFEIRDDLFLGDMVDYSRFAELAQVDESTAKALFAYYAADKGQHRTAESDLEHFEAPLLELFLFLHDRVEAGDVELEAEQRELVDELYGQLNLLRGQLVSDKHNRIVLELALPVQSEETFAFLNTIHVLGQQAYGEKPILTGNSVSALDFKDSFASDNTTVGLMSLALVMLILFFTFKSFGMPLLLIFVIQGSIWLNFAVTTLQHKPVFFLCSLIVGAIQMGANIDYAIVVSSRYTQLRETTMAPREAIIETMNLAFPTIITSGLMMVCAGLLIGFQVSQCIIAGMGYYVGTGTSISLLLILFALPQLLLLGDRFVALTRVRPENSSLLAYAAANRRRLTAGLLTFAALLALIAVPFTLRSGELYYSSACEYSDTLLAETERLEELADRIRDARDGSLSYGFAEQLMTEEIGAAQLAEGEAKYRDGRAALRTGQAEYDMGASRLSREQEKYNAGVQKLEDAQAQYDAGLAQYLEGKEQFDIGSAELAEAQRQYDEGLAACEAARQQLAEGQAQYDEGLRRYLPAKAAFELIAPLFERAQQLAEQYEDLQAQYDQAIADEDYATAFALSGQLAAAKYAYESSDFETYLAQYQAAKEELDAAEQELREGGAELAEGYAKLAEAEQQLAEGKKQLDEGYAKQAEAEQQLAVAERQLDEAKAQLDAGYAELDAGGALLNAGRNELNAAGEQLSEGQKALQEAQSELRDGRAQLYENQLKLKSSIAALDILKDDEERLSHGLALLQGQAMLSAIPQNGTAGAYLSAVRERIGQFRQDAASQRHSAQLLAVCLGLSVLFALLACLLHRRRTVLSARMAALSALTALVFLCFWVQRCRDLGLWLLLPAALLLLSAAVFSAFFFRQHRQTSAQEQE